MKHSRLCKHSAEASSTWFHKVSIDKISVQTAVSVQTNHQQTSVLQAGACENVGWCKKYVDALKCIFFSCLVDADALSLWIYPQLRQTQSYCTDTECLQECKSARSFSWIETNNNNKNKNAPTWCFEKFPATLNVICDQWTSHWQWPLEWLASE